MSSLYCFRHGQAGLRDDYDTLSLVGKKQARLMGDYLAAQNTSFDAFLTGGLQRQRQTADEIRTAYREAGVPLPEPQVDEQWNEFDLGEVYRGIAPQLATDDSDFRRHYEALEKEAADAASSVHRKWTPSDIAVIRAWIEGRYEYNGESWAGFTNRVCGALQTLSRFGPGETVAVSTSATPIAIWMGLALNLENPYIMRAAGALYNASISSFRLHEGEVHLFTFNHIPHLADPALRTFR